MKDINNYKAEKYDDENVYEKVENGIYYNKDENIYVTSLSFVQEPEFKEGINADELSGNTLDEIKQEKTYHISQYPLEEILDEFFCYVSDFYEQLNSFDCSLSYLEFASDDINDIRNLRTIIGKHVYDKQEGNQIKFIIE